MPLLYKIQHVESRKGYFELLNKMPMNKLCVANKLYLTILYMWRTFGIWALALIYLIIGLSYCNQHVGPNAAFIGYIFAVQLLHYGFCTCCVITKSVWVMKLICFPHTQSNRKLSTLQLCSHTWHELSFYKTRFFFHGQSIIVTISRALE